MKKRKILFFCLGMLILCAVAVVAYQFVFKVNPMELAKKSVSEMGTCYFVDNTNSLATLKVSSGIRENPYNLDGVHNEMQPFALLIFKTSITNAESPSYIATIDGVEYQGVLEFNPCDNTFATDLQISLNNTSNIKVSVQVNDNDFEFAPTNQNTTWVLSFSEALDKGLEEVKDTIKELTSKGKFNGECYVRVISDTACILKDFYYYVTVVDTNGNIYSVVIDCKSGEIIKTN